MVSFPLKRLGDEGGGGTRGVVSGNFIKLKSSLLIIWGYGHIGGAVIMVTKGALLCKGSLSKKNIFHFYIIIEYITRNVNIVTRK